MSKVEYLSRLRYCLEKGGLGIEDIEDALRYYEEIFLDAGEEREQETAKNLGLPEDLARGILIDNGIHVDGAPTYTIKNGGNDQTFNNPKTYNEGNGKSRNDNNSGMIVKLILICVTFPIWLPVIIAIGGIAFGLLVAAIAIVFSFIVVGVTCTVAGILSLLKVPPVGLVITGVGLVFAGLSGLILWPICKGIWRLAVRFVKWIVSILRRSIGTGGARVNE